MARFDVYLTGSGDYLLDVQTDLIPPLGTRLVVPLMPNAGVPNAIGRLHPIFEVDGNRLVMATHLMGAVPVRQLGQRVGRLWDRYDDIVAAIDMIFLGF
jgi:toxin CcdB